MKSSNPVLLFDSNTSLAGVRCSIDYLKKGFVDTIGLLSCWSNLDLYLQYILVNKGFSFELLDLIKLYMARWLNRWAYVNMSCFFRWLITFPNWQSTIQNIGVYPFVQLMDNGFRLEMSIFLLPYRYYRVYQGKMSF